MIGEPHGVGRAHRGRGRRIEEEAHDAPGGLVAHQDVPVPVEHHGGIRLLLPEHEAERPPHLGHLRRVQGRLPIDRGVSGDGQQLVAAAERDLEHAGQEQHHLAARLGAAGLEEAEMPRRDPRRGGQPELAHGAPLAPLPEQLPHPARRHATSRPARTRADRHGRHYTADIAAPPLRPG
jgi:hypothetical protein